MRRSLASLGLALVPAALGVWLTTTLANEPGATLPDQQQRRTSGAAADLLVREQAIEARLAALAADPEIARLAEGLSDPAGRERAQEALSALRASDGPIVSGACITRVADARTTVLVVGSDARASAIDCATDTLLSQASRSAAGMVSRAMIRTPSGARLLVATRLGVDGVSGSVLAAGIDLAKLFAATPSASAEASTALIVEGPSAVILAGSTRPADAESGAGAALQPREVASYVRGIVTSYRPTIDDLASAGWLTSVASLWPTVDGSGLALIHLWPKRAPSPPIGLYVALAGLAAAAVVGAFAFVRHLDRPFRELQESQANLATLYREAREDSLHDGLTAMGNHRSYREELARQFERFESDGVPFSLLLIDLDDLKVVNDRDGHAEGDRLLTSLASNMREAFRETDRLFRTGGDEFVVIMPDTEADDAVKLAARLQHYCTRPASGERPVAFSGGLSAVPQFTREMAQLSRQADIALYWAKRHGRGFVERFDPERDQVPGESGQDGLDNAIHEVIHLRALSPVFQPIVDLRNGAILGFEGLIRPAAQNPFPDPYRLFAAAAATNRTVELDLAALEVVAAGASAISHDRIVSINLSSKTLEVKDFDSAWLLNTLRRHGIAPERVILELTERDPISDLKRLHRNLMHLSEYGFRFAADDLGAGNAGLKLLSELPFDVVKIDLSLVQEAARNTATWAVLRSVRDFAWRQHAIVIGEGVETPEQVQALRQLDIDIGQGYLLGKPLPLSDLGPRDRASLAPTAVGPDAAPAAPTGKVPILDGPYRLDGPPALDGRPEPDGRPSPLPGPGTDVTVLRPLQPRILAITPG
jgi:diguanylate cyclase (GGDEF)-like protein